MVLQQDQEKRFDTELFIIPHTNENEDKLYPPGDHRPRGYVTTIKLL